MNRILLIPIVTISIFTASRSVSAVVQEGRPALPAETIEDARVKEVIKAALPHALSGWTVEDESDTTGVTGFHNGSDAVSTPFTHHFAIQYKKQVSESERQRLVEGATSDAAVARLLASTSAEVIVDVNTFFEEFTSATPHVPSSRPPFAVSLAGDLESRFYLGPWTGAASQADGASRTYTVRAAQNRRLPGGQIQSVRVHVKGAREVVDAILAKTDTAALAALVGQNLMPIPAATSDRIEPPLVRPAPGDNAVSFTIDGGELHNVTVQLKPSKVRQFGYLNNYYPLPSVTANAVTRLLASEDDDFKAKMQSGFFDVTLPLVRQTGSVEIQPDVPKATLAGGIQCWEGCQWSFNAERVTVVVTKYEPVNGFIEGTFSGRVTLGYRLSQPVDHKETTATIVGTFKLRRNADRY